MFVKIFGQIHNSSVADDYQVRLVFQDFLILADKDGHVDMTAAAIARRTNVPIEIVTRAIEVLSSPDPESRSPGEEGRRIVLLDSDRSWGWRVVNYKHYRAIRDDEARKEYYREAKRAQRRNSKTVQDKVGLSNNVTQAEAEAEAEAKELSLLSPEPTTPTPTDFCDSWNRLCGALPKVRVLTDSRRKRVQARIRQGIPLETFEAAVTACTEKPFLRGENPSGWTATFDWLIKNDHNIDKAITNYGSPARSPSKPDLLAGMKFVNGASQ